ncbi:Anaphase-promoting complex subunit 13 [Halotydeus destructor]|nr:Anaphase-promoting complex subunit 13 [Halotydeus destructor]
MDSQVRREGRLILIVDKTWRDDIVNLPHEEIAVPLMELPDPEPDNGNPMETLKEQEFKWTDLALSRISSNDHHNNAVNTNNQ